MIKESITSVLDNYPELAPMKMVEWIRIFENYVEGLHFLIAVSNHFDLVPMMIHTVLRSESPQKQHKQQSQ